MNDRNDKKFGKNALAAGGIVIIIAAATYLGLLHFGIGGNVTREGDAIVQKSVATIGSAWQNLSGGTTYDVNPDEDSAFLGTDASDTAIVDDASSSDTVSFDSDAEGSASSDDFLESSSEIATISPRAPNVPSSSNPNQNPQNVTQPTCAFPSTGVAASSSSVRNSIVNEIAWMGSPPAAGESTSAAANDEWIELKNISDADVNLNGWEFFDASGAIKIIFANDDIIPANGFFLLARGTTSVVAQNAAIHYSGSLSNTGDQVALLDAQCNVVDFVDASSGWPGGNNTTKQTLERATDHVSWQTSAPVGGTPGAENSAGAPAAQQSSSTQTSTLPATSTASQVTSTPAIATGGGGGNQGTVSASGGVSGSTTDGDASTTAAAFCPADHVVIAQIQIAGGSSANDFVKLYNPGAAAVDMSGWRLRKKTSGGTDASLKVLPNGSAIAAGAYFTWANSANGFAASIGADMSSTETIAADNSAALIDASGTIVDEVAWGTGINQYVEGNPFPTNPAANQILERAFVNGAIGDSDDNAADFTLH